MAKSSLDEFAELLQKVIVTNNFIATKEELVATKVEGQN